MLTATSLSTVRVLAARVRRAPSELWKTEFQLLLHVIKADETRRLRLQRLEESHGPTIGQRAINLFQGVDSDPETTGLTFAPTPAARAAVGYQILSWIPDPGRTPQEVLQAVVYGGNRYPIPGGGALSMTQRVERVVDIFIDPLIDYLDQVQDLDEIAQAVMIRYKRRSEWFDRDRLIHVGWSDDAVDDGGIIDTSKPPTGQAEHRLVLDFAKYLFDWPTELVLEPQTPGSASRVDLLAPTLDEEARLLVEAKIYDGSSRDADYISRGIAQAADYAQLQGVPYAYLLVFNASPDSDLLFPGSAASNGGWVVGHGTCEVRIVVVDLVSTLPASRASEREQISIDIS